MQLCKQSISIIDQGRTGQLAPRAPRAKVHPTSVMQEFYQPFKLRSEHSDTG